MNFVFESLCESARTEEIKKLLARSSTEPEQLLSGWIKQSEHLLVTSSDDEGSLKDVYLTFVDNTEEIAHVCIRADELSREQPDLLGLVPPFIKEGENFGTRDPCEAFLDKREKRLMGVYNLAFCQTIFPIHSAFKIALAMALYGKGQTRFSQVDGCLFEEAEDPGYSEDDLLSVEVISQVSAGEVIVEDFLSLRQ